MRSSRASKVPHPDMSKMSLDNLNKYYGDMTRNSGIVPTNERLNQLERYDMSKRITDSLASSSRPSTARTSYSRISSQQISNTLNNILDDKTRTLLAIQDATRNTNGTVNKVAVKNVVSASNASLQAQHRDYRIGVLTTQFKETQHQEELRREERERIMAQRELDKLRKLREEKRRMDSVSEYDGGYAKLTKVGLLTRIMNIKKKAKVAKPTVRKAAKPVKKPVARKAAKPAARKAAKPVKPVRRKPTIVRRK